MHKYQLHILSVFLFGFIFESRAQIVNNFFIEKKLKQSFSQLSAIDSSYLMYPDFFDTEKSKELQYGMDFSASWQNSALSQYSNYNNQIHYLVSPFGHFKFNDQITFDVRGNIENKKDELVYQERTYWSDEFANHRGGFEIAKITFNTKNFFVKFGRDYFLQGLYLYENLLFSKYNYPYDQIVYGFKNEFFELSSYYLALNSLQDSDVLNLRHLNGHRLSINLKIGYLAFNEVILYGGENRQINIMLFNPFMIYYAYQKNTKNFESNSLVSMELYLNYHNYFFFGEFLLDDFQIDKDVPGDLEPNEWGMNVTLGKNKIFKELNWKINYTMVANRTYNAPEKDYEKYIYKNYPIGHWLGNNFWELKSSFTFIPNNQIFVELNISHFEYGKESLYSPFNKNYLNYTVEEGYSESFPFGNVDVLSGFEVSGYYHLFSNLLLKANMGYWFNNHLLEQDFSFGFGIAYQLKN